MNCIEGLSRIPFEYKLDEKAGRQTRAKEDVYMEVPEGVPGIPPGYVIKLAKSIYGLKQSAAQFWYEMDAHLQKIGFYTAKNEPLKVDYCEASAAR